MIDRINEIKKLAIGMRDTTSTNDERRAKLQRVSDICDDLLHHFIDEGR